MDEALILYDKIAVWVNSRTWKALKLEAQSQRKRKKNLWNTQDHNSGHTAEVDLELDCARVKFYCTIVNLFCGRLIDWEIWNWSCPSKTSNDTSIMATYTWNLELWKGIIAFSLTINFVALKSNSDFVISDNDDENDRDANLDRTYTHNCIEC